MLKNYFKTAFRNFWRQKGYTFLNISGLSVGLACCVLILLWIQDETRINQFHEEGDQLFQVMRNAYFSDGEVYTWGAIPMPLAQTLEEKYPEITDAVLVSWDEPMVLSLEKEAFWETGKYAAPGFFDIFSFPVIAGDPQTVLDDPDAVVISASLAEKFFGSSWQEKAVGQTLRLNNEADLKVTGIFEDPPSHSTLKFDFVIPIERFIKENDWVHHWGNNGLRLYVRLKSGSDHKTVTEKISQTIKENLEKANSIIFLHPFEDLYLYSKFEEGILVGGRIDYVWLFFVVSVFMLLIASINFMNLSTARSGKRAREIGVRKVVGASKRSLIVQFMGESVLLSLISLLLAVVLIELMLPSFNDLTGKEISINYLHPLNVSILLGLALCTGLLSGIYPALMLSSFKVVHILKGSLSSNLSAAFFRKGLVVFQFVMSIMLIIGTLTVYRQLSFIQTKNLGLDRENLVYLNLDGKAKEKYQLIRNDLLQIPGITQVTMANQNPLQVSNSTQSPKWEGKTPEDEILFSIINADLNFLETMKMELAAGRTFSRDFPTDSVNYVINEVAAKAMRMEDPIGQTLEFWDQKGQIIGVVKDFHFSSLYDDIDPLIIRFAPDLTWLMFARIEGDKTVEALAGLENILKTHNPTYPVDYKFLDESFERTYKSEMVIGKLANYFAILTIFISCLGLFGLASFTAEQRIKEIGIRKILGASVSHLVFLLTSDFTKLVFIAFLIAAPLAWYFLNDWLSQFAYHASLGVGIFALGGGLALLISWLTISFQSFKAATANPVKSIRTE